MNKPTDNEIKKALEQQLKENKRIYSMDIVFLRSLVDLINRLEAENERLREKCENTQIGYNFAQDDIKTLKKDKYKLQKALNLSEDYRVIAKAEARKEFTKLLIDKSKNGVIHISDIPDYVKDISGGR